MGCVPLLRFFQHCGIGTTMVAQIPVASTCIALSAASFTLIPVVSTFIPVTLHGVALVAVPT